MLEIAFVLPKLWLDPEKKVKGSSVEISSDYLESPVSSLGRQTRGGSRGRGTRGGSRGRGTDPLADRQEVDLEGGGPGADVGEWGQSLGRQTRADLGGGDIFPSATNPFPPFIS